MSNEKNILHLTIPSRNGKLTFASGTALSQILHDNHIDFYQPCGGQGTCGKCLVRFTRGAPPITYYDRLYISPDEIDAGYRLGCKSVLEKSAELDLPEAEDIQHAVVETGRVSSSINPLMHIKKISVGKPDLESGKSDAELVAEASGMQNMSLPVLHKLPDMLRKNDYQISVLIANNSIIEVFPADESPPLYGIAFDLGTTTLVTSLVDIPAGKTVAVESVINPQTRYGDDLVSRLSFVIKQEGSRVILSDVVTDRLNKMISDMCTSAGIQSDQIYVMVVSGNVVMNHLFLGIDPRYVGSAPFTPVFREMRFEKSTSLGLSMHPQAQVLVMPNIGGYVGGDIVSDLLAAGFGKDQGKTRLLVDIGTNCEVVLEHKGKMWAASSPAGPALEGSCIRHGMRAEGGAIYDCDGINGVFTIKDRPARGICGSGLFHLIDVLYRERFIDQSGRILLTRTDTTDGQFIPVDEGRSRSIRITDRFHGAERDIFLTQDDIREFQLARSAIVAVWKLLCRFASCSPQDISEIYIAGAFGNFIRPEAAINLGLVPARNLNHIHFIGNGSLEGGRMTLLDKDIPQQVQNMTRDIRFVEMAGRQDFQDLYIENMHFPPY